MADEHPEPAFRGRDLAGVGGLLVGAVVAGMLLGLLYDDRTGSSPAGVLVGIGLGVVLGCAAAILRVRRALRG